jgi:pimeloyl-ACP methyl ester carboxylesterase
MARDDTTETETSVSEAKEAAMTTTTRMIETCAGRLHVEVDGDGPPAVLWHSLFVDSHSWWRMRSLLRDERRLIIVDGPGHGQSCTPPETFTLGDCAQAAVEVMDSVEAGEPVDWVGNAWGGHVGLTLAAKAPERFRSVATIATPVHALTRRERLTIVPMVGVYRFIGAVPPLANGVARALLGPAFMRSWPEDTAAVVAAFRSAPRVGMHRAMRSVMLRRADLDPLLPTIAIPTLMAVPTDDAMLPAGQIRAAVRQMPCAAAVEVEAEGHVAPIIANAEQLAALLKAFWRDPRGYVCGRVAH